MLNPKELRDQTKAELEVLGRGLAKELFELRSQKRLSKKNDKPHLLRQKRRDRARVLTIIRQKEGS